MTEGTFALLPIEITLDRRLTLEQRAVESVLDAYESTWSQCDGMGGALFSDIAQAALRRGLAVSKTSIKNAVAHCEAMDEIAVALSRVKWVVVQLAARDGLNCHYCGTPLTAATLQIDHVVPRARGGSNDLSNLVLACALCNNRKKAQDADTFAARAAKAAHEH